MFRSTSLPLIPARSPRGRAGRVLILRWAAASATSWAVLAVPLCAPSSAMASEKLDAPSAYGVIGPFGLGVGFGSRIAPHWAARFQVNSGASWSRKEDFTEHGVHYDSRYRSGAGFSALADYYPSLDSGWRVTGGVVYSSIKPQLTGRPDAQGNFTLNNHSYSAAQVGELKGRQKVGPLNLYVGGGWESAPLGTPGWRFVSDLGLFYGGRSSAKLNASNEGANPALAADVQAERKRLEKQGLGLALSLGVAYGF